MRDTGCFAVLAALLGSGCYSGLSTGPDAHAEGGLAEDSGGSSHGEDDDDDDDGPVESLCEDPGGGAASLRRLTRAEYVRTVEDLLGVTDVSVAFPPDERVAGYPANVSAIGELTVEHVMSAAETVAEQAVLAQPIEALTGCDDALEGESACAAKFIAEYGRRAFRRPLTDAERERMQALFDAVSAEEGYAAGIQATIEASLQAPQFLYHVEVGRDGPTIGDAIALTSHELANRLSYALWGTAPDAILAQAADADTLTTVDAVREQAERMLADDRAAVGIATLMEGWLGLEGLADLDKDPDAFPAFSPELAEAMGREVAAFADDVVRTGDGRFETLMTASYSVVDDPALARLYGVESELAGGRVELDPSQRAGLLTQPAFLAVHGGTGTTSVVRRGLAVRKSILCQSLAPPPPDVDTTLPEPEDGVSARDHLEQHRTDPNCAGCHEYIDPVGLLFEHYDGIGAWRESANGAPVDASGQVVGVGIEGSMNGAVELSHALADNDEVRACFADNAFRFLHRRRSGEEDECSRELATIAFAESGYDVRELLLAFVTSDSFRFLLSDQ